MPPVDDDLVRALHETPGCTVQELAHAAGLPRTNFGRQLTGPAHKALGRMVAAGLVERRGRRYRLSRVGHAAERPR